MLAWPHRLSTVAGAEVTGYVTIVVYGDGHCYFRCVAVLIYGNSDQHYRVRKEVCDWMDEHAPWILDRYNKRFKSIEEVETYVKEMRETGLSPTYGTDIEVWASCQLYVIHIDVIDSSSRDCPPTSFRYSGPIDGQVATVQLVRTTHPDHFNIVEPFYLFFET